MNEVIARIPFSAGCLAWRQVQQALTWARAHEVQVEVHSTGRFVRRGWLVASGPEDRVEAFHRLLCLIAQ